MFLFVKKAYRDQDVFATGVNYFNLIIKDTNSSILNYFNIETKSKRRGYSVLSASYIPNIISNY